MPLEKDPGERDEDVIISYKNGDLEAFKRLINRYTSPLYNFTAHLTNRNDAPDIVQEIFIKVWKNIGRFNPKKASFKTWIFTIARNTATDFLRKKKSILFSDMENFAADGASSADSFFESIPDEQILPDAALSKIQDKEFLDELISELNPSYREILVLHYQEEMTFDEIGKILNRPLNTVKSAHRRAVIELSKKIN